MLNLIIHTTHSYYACRIFRQRQPDELRADLPLLAEEGLLVTEQADEGLDLVPVPPLPALEEPALDVFFIYLPRSN